MDGASLLYVSDCPETFDDHGRLFHAPLTGKGGVVRLLFDHVNGTRSPMRVVAGIANSTGKAGSITLRGGTGGPDTNFMAVGHAATLRYFQSLVAGADATKAVGPTETQIVASAILQPGECFAGIFDVSIPDQDANYEIRVVACDPQNSLPTAFAALPESPDDGKSRRGVFDISGSQVSQGVRYLEAPVVFVIGDATFARDVLDPYAGPPHKGGYGIVRSFDCTLLGSGRAWLYQSARAGEATATYLIDGQLLASHGIPAGPRSKIVPFDLVQGRQQSVNLQTMAEINSSYPLQLSFDVDDPTLADAGTGNSPVFTVG